MSIRLLVSRKVAELVALGLLAGVACSSAGPSVSSPSASLSTTPATVSATPIPTPIAVLDGEPWIAYQWVPEDGQSLYLMRPDGSDAHEIATELPGEAGHPDWSPDGKLIAFDVMVSDGVFEIWTVKADGSDPQKVLGCEAGPCVEVGGASWSLDGRQLVFGRLTNAIGSYKDDHITLEALDLATRETRVIAVAPPVATGTLRSSTPTVRT